MMGLGGKRSEVLGGVQHGVLHWSTCAAACEAAVTAVCANDVHHRPHTASGSTQSSMHGRIRMLGRIRMHTQYQSEHRAAPARSNMRSNMRSNARQHDHDRHSRMLGWAHPRAFDSAGRCQMHADMRLTAPGAVKCTLEVRVVVSPWPLHVRGAFVIAVRSHTALLATSKICHHEAQNCLYTCLVHVENANASMELTSS
jgi:hypothetical protein